MIEKKDLREGNLVSLAHESNEPAVTIDALHKEWAVFKEQNLFTSRIYDHLMPIELNPDWLEGFGFGYSDGANEYGTYRNNIIELYEHDEEPGLFHFSRGLFRGEKVEIKYVHQLQNLHYFLTGKELEFKTTNTI